MIIPVRCFTCGKVLADKWQFYERRCRELGDDNPSAPPAHRLAGPSLHQQQQQPQRGGGDNNNNKNNNKNKRRSSKPPPPSLNHDEAPTEEAEAEKSTAVPPQPINQFNITKTVRGRVLDELGLTNSCCRTVMLTHVDMMDII